MPNDIDNPRSNNDNTSEQLEEQVLSEQESEKLDNDLFEIELICRARCVTPSILNNVVVQEIEDKPE
jgi:hypothetical protein